MLLEGRRGQDGLEGGARLEGVGHGAVSPLVDGGRLVGVRIEGGTEGRRQELSRPGVHDQDHAGPRARRAPRLLELALGDVLDGGVEGQD